MYIFGVNPQAAVELRSLVVITRDWAPVSVFLLAQRSRTFRHNDVAHKTMRLQQDQE